MNDNNNILTNLFSQLQTSFATMDDMSLSKEDRIEGGFKPAYQAVQQIDNLVSYLKGDNSGRKFSFVNILHMSKLPPLRDEETKQGFSFEGAINDIMKAVDPNERDDFLEKIISGEAKRETSQSPDAPNTLVISQDLTQENILDDDQYKRLYEKFEKTFVRMDSQSESERTSAYNASYRHAGKIREAGADNENFGFTVILKTSNFEKRLEREMQGFDIYASVKPTFSASSETGLHLSQTPQQKPLSLSQAMKLVNSSGDAIATGPSTQDQKQESLDDLKQIPWEEIKGKLNKNGAVEAIMILFTELNTTKDLISKLERGEKISEDDYTNMTTSLLEKYEQLEGGQLEQGNTSEEQVLYPTADFCGRQKLRDAAIVAFNPELEKLVTETSERNDGLFDEAMESFLDEHYASYLGVSSPFVEARKKFDEEEEKEFYETYYCDPKPLENIKQIRWEEIEKQLKEVKATEALAILLKEKRVTEDLYEKLSDPMQRELTENDYIQMMTTLLEEYEQLDKRQREHGGDMRKRILEPIQGFSERQKLRDAAIVAFNPELKELVTEMSEKTAKLVGVHTTSFFLREERENKMVDDLERRRREFEKKFGLD